MSRYVNADWLIKYLSDTRRKLPHDIKDFHTRDTMLLNFQQIVALEATIDDIELPGHPVGVLRDGNEFNTDVYCPYCGVNLSGYYGDEPPRIVTCYQCGGYIDVTKTLTDEEREVENEPDQRDT